MEVGSEVASGDETELLTNTDENLAIAGKEDPVATPESASSLLNMYRKNIDGISLLGR